MLAPFRYLNILVIFELVTQQWECIGTTLNSSTPKILTLKKLPLLIISISKMGHWKILIQEYSMSQKFCKGLLCYT